MKSWLQKILSVIVFVGVLGQGLFIGEISKAEAQFSGGASIFQGAGPILGAGIGCGLNKLLNLGTNKLEGLTTGAVDINDPATKSLEKKETCWKKIQRAAAQTLLRKVTQATVNWINTGFKGSPAFVQNPISFFESIGNEELSSLTAQIIVVSPFGKDIARNLIASLQANFSMYAQYSLDKVIGSAQAEQFQADFAVGGWDGWLAMTQLPQNNQIGATIITGDEFSRKLAGYQTSKIQEIKTELQQNFGFLSLKVCAVPSDYVDPPADWDKTQDMIIANSQPKSTSGFGGLGNSTGPWDGTYGNTTTNAWGGVGNFYTQAEIDAAKERLRKYTCIREETRTPGGVLSHQLNTALDIPTNSLINSEDLDASLTAIFDALLNQMMQKGLSALADTSSSGTNPYQYNGGSGSNTGSSSNGGSGVSQTHWNHPANEFDINTGLPGIIKDQQDYLDRLGPGNTYGANKLTKTGAINQMLPAIYKADFCLPGPAANWQDTVYQNEAAALAEIQKASGTAPIFTVLFRSYTGVDTSGAMSKERIMSLFQRIVEGGVNEDPNNPVQLEGFVDIMKKKFNLFNLPTVGSEINQLYNSIPTYQNEFPEIEAQIGQMKSNISKLTYINSQLPQAYALYQQDQTAPNTDYEMLVRTFQSMTSNLVTADDVKALEAEIYQIQFDTKDAVDLFYRCRKEVDGIDKNGTNIGTTYTGPTQRTSYPKDLLSVQEQAASLIPTTSAFLDDVFYGGGLPNGAYAEIHVTDVININSALGVPTLENNLGVY